ncbi:MAG: peptidoglycan editing factor PgeF [Veillonella sp.]|uniref:peptidoglycan editing factor PgeF n=1 Tax=Veillonella sp. TaxID=1926307 RepID=UPI00257FDFFB|nr:peptidoglycan editing factor PgeF [Veillonella sp.]MBS6892693.1 peptidoglycan editing factor PgeF [Veillonella sp.]MDU3706182.1 peptidoglycan editing factor PgeF [Veillonella sp.]
MGITVVNVNTNDRRWSFEMPNWANQFSLVMGDTYRHGGVSKTPCESLNLATHIGDSLQDVLENRSIVANHLGVTSDRITCGNQVHGLKAVRITEELIGAGALSPDTAIPDCDAVYTDIPNVPLFLFTADCVPVGIYDPVHHVVATVHAGWRGAIGHLPVITIEAMKRDFGTRFEDCYVYLGPSIGPKSFEVNQELADTFTDEWKKITDTTSDELVRYIVREGALQATPHVDLWRFIEEDLLQRGVPKGQICISGTDSMTDENCFSYRREHGKTGRMALFGMLEKR